MPSKNKRVNLTIPPDLYDRLQAFIKDNGYLSVSGACLHLIIKELMKEGYKDD